MNTKRISGPGYCKVPNQRSVEGEMELECEWNLGLYGNGIWIRVGPAGALAKSSIEEMHENVLKITPEQARLFIANLTAQIDELESYKKQLSVSAVDFYELKSFSKQ